MSIFGKIKDAIFGKKAEAAPAPAPSPTNYDPVVNESLPSIDTITAPATQQVDVEQVLEAKMAEKGNPDLNWKTSIVDLMKLLGIDSSRENREELARELGYTGEMGGSAEMNMWLHKEVMRQLAANGGTVPANLTD